MDVDAIATRPRHERGLALSVVVPSRNRHLRLRWLLNALEEQTLERDRWEVVVVDESSGAATRQLLETHPLAEVGLLRALHPPSGLGPAANRNIGWRAARGKKVLFTDDDCRPPPNWLERAHAAIFRHGDAIIQGTTRPDPDEAAVLAGAPWARSQDITPPVVWAQTCNIVYPRRVLEDVGGFDEQFPGAAGEDTDLALRARRAGAKYVAAPDVVTYHAVYAESLLRRLRSIPRWEILPYMLRRNPELRRDFPLWMFWKRTHVWLPAALAGVVLSKRNPVYAGLALPWVIHTMPAHGSEPRGRFRSVAELPGRAVIDVAEFVTLVRGSLKHKTVLL